ncbi:MAG: hypothetical protein NTW28_35200 [Candidatus Solibacter sp.]|nr:hypothetical protein [Candidatus Solibacter sp.]
MRPMIGSWEVPRIARIAAAESRRFAVLPVPGLSGDLHQDLGRSAMVVEISGALYSDEARDGFLKDLREKYLAGEPVTFVADIIKESELEQVLIESFDLEENSARPDQFFYSLRLREYTEPPEPPGIGADLGVELDADLSLDALSGLDLLDLPNLLPGVPALGDMLAPLKPAAEELKTQISKAGEVLTPLKDLLGQVAWDRRTSRGGGFARGGSIAGQSAAACIGPR